MSSHKQSQSLSNYSNSNNNSTNWNNEKSQYQHKIIELEKEINNLKTQNSDLIKMIKINNSVNSSFLSNNIVINNKEKSKQPFKLNAKTDSSSSGQTNLGSKIVQKTLNKVNSKQSSDESELLSSFKKKLTINRKTKSYGAINLQELLNMGNLQFNIPLKPQVDVNSINSSSNNMSNSNKDYKNASISNKFSTFNTWKGNSNVNSIISKLGVNDSISKKPLPNSSNYDNCNSNSIQNNNQPSIQSGNHFLTKAKNYKVAKNQKFNNNNTKKLFLSNIDEVLIVPTPCQSEKHNKKINYQTPLETVNNSNLANNFNTGFTGNGSTAQLVSSLLNKVTSNYKKNSVEASTLKQQHLTFRPSNNTNLNNITETTNSNFSLSSNNVDHSAINEFINNSKTGEVSSYLESKDTIGKEKEKIKDVNINKAKSTNKNQKPRITINKQALEFSLSNEQNISNDSSRKKDHNKLDIYSPKVKFSSDKKLISQEISKGDINENSSKILNGANNKSDSSLITNNTQVRVATKSINDNKVTNGQNNQNTDNRDNLLKMTENSLDQSNNFSELNCSINMSNLSHNDVQFTSSKSKFKEFKIDKNVENSKLKKIELNNTNNTNNTINSSLPNLLENSANSSNKTEETVINLTKKSELKDNISNTNLQNNQNISLRDSIKSFNILPINTGGNSPKSHPSYVIKYHLDSVRAITICKERSILISAGDDLVLNLWNLKEEKDIKEPITSIRAHNTPVFNLESNGGDEFFSCGIDGVIRHWKINDSIKKINLNSSYEESEHLQVGSWHASNEMIWSLKYFNNYLASASCDGSIKIWKVSEYGKQKEKNCKLFYFYLKNIYLYNYSLYV